MENSRRDFKDAVKLIRDIIEESEKDDTNPEETYYDVVNMCQDFLEKKGIPCRK